MATRDRHDPNADDSGHECDWSRAARQLQEAQDELKRAQILAQVGSWRFELATGRVDASAEARRIYGIGQQEWSVREVQTVPLQQYRETLDRALRELVSDGRPYDVEFEIRRPSDQQVRWIHSVAEYDSEHHRIVGTLQDITERKRTEQSLRDQRQRLEFIIAASGLGTWVWNVQSKETEFNEGWARMLGYSLAELEPTTIETWSRLTHPEDLERANNSLTKCLSDDQRDYECELRMRHRDGHWVWILDRGRVMTRDAAGRPLMMFGTHVNISRRKEAEAALAASERKWRDILVNTPQIGISLDQRGRIVFANTRFLELTGWAEEEILGRDWFDTCIPDEVRETVREVFQRTVRAREAGSLSAFENEILTKAGERRNVAWSNLVTTDSGGAVVDVTCLGIDLTERLRAEQALREEEARYRELYEGAAIGIFHSTFDGRFLDVNPTLARMLGYDSPHEVMESITDISRQIYASPPERNAILEELLAAGRIVTVENRYLRRDGSEWDGRLHLRCITAKDGAQRYLEGFVEDISDHKRAEQEREQLREALAQAQKMESIGRLAGGVAHDFNNMLNVILGHAELARDELPESHPVRDDLKEIENAAERSAELTGQLLAFARKQTIKPKTIDLNMAVSSSLQMLRRLIGENIELRWAPSQEPWLVTMDPNQLDQLLTNLCVNARDAIDGHGTIDISSDNAVLDEDFCTRHSNCSPGEYAVLEVSDNGRGIDDDTLEHIFEPFFTTKAEGRGTGLGLATVHGIVKQNHGAIEVDSSPGQGTSFRVFMPRREETRSELGPAGEAHPAARGHETILLVEDELPVLELATSMLERLGYRVLATSTPSAALTRAAAHSEPIDLVVTDVIMPEMNGRELVERLTRSSSKLKTLFVSGYPAEVISRRGVLDENVHFLQKPFTMKTLATSVRNALES